MGEKKAVVGKKWKPKISHILILLLLIAIGAFVYFRVSLKDEIQERIEAIRSEGYPVTFEELDQWYSIPLDAENSAYIVIDAIDYYTEPNNAQVMPVVGPVQLPSRTEPMPKKMKNLISQYLMDNQKSLELLHKTADLEYGRYPINLSLGLGTLTPNLSEIRKCAFLLRLESVYSSENGDSTIVVNSIKSIFGAARTLSREPILVSQLVRIAIENLGISSLEYSMNRITFSNEEMNELGDVFQKAEDSSGMKLALVGERCFTLSVFENPMSISNNVIGGGLPATPLLGIYKALGIMDKEAVIFLDLEKEYIDAFELPAYKQIVAFEAIQVKVDALPRVYLFLHNLMPAYSRVIVLNIRNIAHLRTAQTALAVQRYRLNNGRLPDSLDKLVPDYLKSVPLDPFDGKEIRYKKLERGFVIYSIGEDMKDDGGKEQPKDKKQGAGNNWDITFIIEK